MSIIHSQRDIDPILPTMLAQARLYEIHDALVLAQDATERSNGYSPSEREAREHIRVALRHTIKLQKGQESYVQEQQNLVCKLCGVIEALETLNAEGVAEDAQTVLVGVARSMAEDLSDNLDSVALPKEGAA